MPATNAEPLQRQACSLIRQLITNGELAPGQAIVEMDLAARFKMSRAPIREALVELENEGLVRRVGSRTRVVAEISFEDILEILDLREMFDGMAARLLAPRITDEDIGKLGEMAKLIDVPNELEETENDFHGYIVDRCGNVRLAKLAALSRAQLAHARIREFLEKRGQLPPAWMLQNYALHRDIVDALASRDPDKAEAAARAHIRENKDILITHTLGSSRRQG